MIDLAHSTLLRGTADEIWVISSASAEPSEFCLVSATLTSKIL